MAPRKSVKSEPSSSSESASNSRGGESDYLAKRARNNEAVKRSREKAREKAKKATTMEDQMEAYEAAMNIYLNK